MNKLLATLIAGFLSVGAFAQAAAPVAPAPAAPAAPVAPATQAVTPAAPTTAKAVKIQGTREKGQESA